MIFLWILLVVIAFYLLDKVCDEYLVDSVDRISRKFQLKAETAAITLMGVASSSPELCISLISLFRSGHHEAIGMGTIVGSASFDLLFVIGVSFFVAKKTKLSWKSFARDILFYFVSVSLLIAFLWDGKIVLWEAIVLTSLYILYIFIVITWQKFFPEENMPQEILDTLILSWRRFLSSFGTAIEAGEEKVTGKKKKWKIIEKFFDKVLSFLFPKKEHFIFVFLLSIGGVGLLSYAVVESAVQIATILHIPEIVVGLTILSFGAAVPDLLTSYIVAREGRGNMGVHNALGANIFALLFGLGLPWVIYLLFSHASIVVDSRGLIPSASILLVSLLFLLFLVMFRRWNVGRISGIILILLYILYLSWSILGVFGIVPPFSIF